MIRIRKGYMLRKVLDMYLVMGIGSEAYRPNCVMSVNDTGVFLWKILEGGAEVGELTAKLTEEYDVTAEAAAQDAEKFLAQLRERELVEEC